MKWLRFSLVLTFFAGPVAFQRGARTAAADPAAALETCEAFLRHDPKNAMGYGHRGLAILLLGREEEATRDFARLRDLLPADAPHLELFVSHARRLATKRPK